MRMPALHAILGNFLRRKEAVSANLPLQGPSLLGDRATRRSVRSVISQAEAQKDAPRAQRLPTLIKRVVESVYHVSKGALLPHLGRPTRRSVYHQK